MFVNQGRNLEQLARPSSFFGNRFFFFLNLLEIVFENYCYISEIIGVSLKLTNDMKFEV